MRTFFRLTVFVFVAHGTASAASLRTPFILATTELACVVTNTGKKPVAVTVSATDAAGAPLAAATDTCTGTPLAPQGTCVVDVTTFSGAVPVGGVCSFTGTGKLRAAGYGVTGASVVAVPAAK
jgi:hypothetical protein